MTDVQESPTAIADFGGTGLRPGDEGYDVARGVFNQMIDRSPAVIARCHSSDDVAAVITHARTMELPLSVYGGGHSVTGAAVVDGGVCLDLRGLRTVDVDPTGRTARVGGGCTWGEVDAATQESGLAVTGGRISTTGVGGLTLGSGSGWIERKLGLTCDSLLEVQLATADGRLVTASDTQNPELFWGLRGGGGNFGVVTRFTFRLHEVGPILLGGLLMYPAAMAGDVVRFYRDFIAGAPDEVCGGLAFICAPPADFVPEPVRGQPVLGVMACYVGPVADGYQALGPLLEFGPPAISMVQPIPYVALQQMLDEACPRGMRNYWTADFLGNLPDEAVDALVERAAQPVSPLTQINLIPGGGAISRVPDDATAFGQRTAPWNVHYLSMWPDPADDELNIAYTKETAAAMEPWTTGRSYLNFIGDEGSDRVADAFGPTAYSRLQALKQEWDPDNVFSHNQNIRPAP